jgi:hypothetical protein
MSALSVKVLSWLSGRASFTYTHPMLKMQTTAAFVLLFIFASQRSAMGKSPRVKSQMALVTL